MTSVAFVELFDRLAAATGTTPGSVLEQELRRLHQEHPAAFSAKTSDVLDGFAAGRVTSPWAFLRSSMRTLAEHRPVVEAEGQERDKAVRLAETWLRNAGLYAPWDEAQRELFGERGHLRPWQGDELLTQRMRTLWTCEQPRAEQAEAERVARSLSWCAARDRLKASSQQATEGTPGGAAPGRGQETHTPGTDPYGGGVSEFSLDLVGVLS